MWVSTVRCERNSRRAMPALVWPLSHQREYIAFARGQGVHRLLGAVHADQTGHDFGVEGGTAGSDALQGVEEVVEVEDSVLEQVAEAPVLTRWTECVVSMCWESSRIPSRG